MSGLNANSEDPSQTPRSVASDLVLHCLPMSLKWVKINSEMIDMCIAFLKKMVNVLWCIVKTHFIQHIRSVWSRSPPIMLFHKWGAKALTRERKRAEWSWYLLLAYTWRSIFSWCGLLNYCLYPLNIIVYLIRAYFTFHTRQHPFLSPL